LLAQFGMDAAVSVPAMVLLENLRDCGLECLSRIGGLEPGLVIEERGPGQAGDLQQNREREVSLEGDEGLDLHRRSCALKARNFPR
jgi:hypothetical protein